MRIFQSLEAISESGLPPNLLNPVRQGMATLIEISTCPGKTYSPEDDGHVVLIEPPDTEADQQAAFGYPLKDAPLEGVFRDEGCFVAVLLFNNQYGLTIVIPDEPWLDPQLRAYLEENLMPAGRCP